MTTKQILFHRKKIRAGIWESMNLKLNASKTLSNGVKQMYIYFKYQCRDLLLHQFFQNTNPNVMYMYRCSIKVNDINVFTTLNVIK